MTIVVDDRSRQPSTPTLDALGGILEHCHEGVVVIDATGRIAFVNPGAERQFGYATGELVGREIDVLVPERYRGRHAGFVSRFAESSLDSQMMGRQGEIYALRKDGSEFVAEGTISKLPIGEQAFYAAVLRDVSARHEAARRIQASEEKYRAIVDGAPDAILVANAETGLIQEANTAAGALFGCDRAELLGRHYDSLHPSEQRELYRSYFSEHLREGRIRVPDGVIVRADGSEVPVAITARPARIADVPVVVGFFRDIRERKRREDELAQARDAAEAASRAKSEFLASMSHELRTPLNGIIGFADLIQRQHLGPIGAPAYADYAGYILTSGHYLLQTIEELLDFARLQAGKFQLHEDDFSPAKAIGECAQMVKYAADNGRLRLELQSLQELPNLHGDPHAFRQVVTNLLSNAVKFTRPGGRISVAGAVTADGGIEITVADTGVGIPEAEQERVFERFEQGDNAMLSARKGSGIGLPLARALMELHGGSLRLASEEGRGTTVTVEFPPSRVA